MLNRMSESRTMWLVVGVLIGLGISYFWPHEPALAATSDRNDKFALATAPVSVEMDLIFVLDFLTGRLHGAAMNRQGTGFAAFYVRNIAADFNVDPQAEPKYAIVGGRAAFPNRAGAQFANCALYVAELSSGRVAAYKVPYRITNRPVLTPVPLIPLAFFPFREAARAE